MFRGGVRCNDSSILPFTASTSLGTPLLPQTTTFVFPTSPGMVTEYLTARPPVFTTKLLNH
jgi:hypothetical protein